MKYEKFFPYKEIRPEQRQVLDALWDNWDKKKYFILQCGVGTGKSGIAKCAANWVEDAFIITQTKQLQEQYMNDFSHEGNIRSIKGRANYECNEDPRLNCENGPCSACKSHKEENFPCYQTCKYYGLRKECLETHNVCTSYAYIFRAFDCAGFWKQRELMVFDECHLIESQFLSFAGFTIDPEFFDKEYDLFANVDNKQRFLEKFTSSKIQNEQRIREFFDVLDKKHNEFNEQIEALSNKKVLFLKKKKKENINESKIADTNEEEITKKLNEIHKKFYELDKVWKKLEVYYESKNTNWVIKPNEDETKLKISPLNINGLFDDYIKKYAKKFIFMSATIIDPNSFIKDLGLKQEECLVINCDSTFDPKRSPIYVMNIGSMNYQNIDETLPKAKMIVNKILDKYKNKRGIIHTSNYRIANELTSGTKEISFENRDRMLMKVNDTTNEELIELHKRSKNSVLVSPSMTTGVDLKDDLSEFQVVVKLPFASLADERTKIKAELDNDWYNYEMIKTLIQECGRSTRSPDDASETFILDSSFTYYINRYRSKIPQSFLKRIVFVK